MFRGGKRLPATVTSRGNRLLFALLSNPKFLKWNADFEQKIRKDFGLEDKTNDPEALKMALARLDKRKLYAEVLDGIKTYGDRDLYAVFLENGKDIRERHAVILPNEIIADVAVEIETLIYAVGVAAAFVFLVASVIDFTPLQPRSGALTRTDLARISNFVTEQLVAQAKLAKKNGAIQGHLIGGV